MLSLSTIAIISCLIVVVHVAQALANVRSNSVVSPLSSGNIGVVEYDVLIVGGGITGLASAVSLIHREKISPERICILEQSRNMSKVGATIGLFPNGVCALESISKELADEICSTGISHRGIIRHTLDKFTGSAERRNISNVQTFDTTEAYSIGRGTYTVAWYLLQEKLAARIPKEVIRFGHVLQNITINNGYNNHPISVTYHDHKTGKQGEIKCKLLIGADGIKSKTRDILYPKYKEEHANNDLQRKMFRAVLPQKSCEGIQKLPHSGYTITYRCDETDRVFAIRKLSENVIGFTTGVTPNKIIGRTKNQWQREDPTTDDKDMKKKDRLRQYFFDFPDDVQLWIESVDPRSIYENDVYDIDILDNWCFFNNCVLIGDAAHGMSPSLGQGANIGLEDSSELASYLGSVLRGEGDDTFATALDKFWKTRFERVKEVHRASRGRERIDLQRNDFREWLFGWKPSFYPECQPCDSDMK